MTTGSDYNGQANTGRLINYTAPHLDAIFYIKIYHQMLRVGLREHNVGDRQVKQPDQ